MKDDVMIKISVRVGDIYSSIMMSEICQWPTALLRRYVCMVQQCKKGLVHEI